MKLKTHSGTKKRVKVTGTGKLIFNKPCSNHLMTNKSKQSRKRNPNGILVSKAMSKRMKRLLPYGA